MTRRFDNIDLFVAVGLCAIVVGTYLTLAAANGSLQGAQATLVSLEQPTSLASGTTLLQPALGQAIVEHDLLEREASSTIRAAAESLNRATSYQEWLQSSPFLRDTIAFAVQSEEQHAGRVQVVMGRSIVNFTRRGVATGLLSADRAVNDLNERLIRRAEAIGRRLEDQFQATRQATLGQAIVNASLRQRNLAQQIQERIGQAVVKVAGTQHAYAEAQAANQEQLASLIVAAIRADALTDRLDRTASVEPIGTRSAVLTSEPKSWPEIPIGYMVAATIGLVAVFCAGLSLPPRRVDTKPTIEKLVETTQRLYRMTG